MDRITGHYPMACARSAVPAAHRWFGVTLLIFMPSRVTKRPIKIRNELMREMTK